jgi:hypothetical protein
MIQPRPAGHGGACLRDAPEKPVARLGFRTEDIA